MAAIFRQKYTPYQTVKGKDGRPVMVKRVATRGKDKGNTVLVPKRERVLGKDGNPVNRESKRWYIEYAGADGQTHRVPGFTDRKATSQLAAKLERQAERGETGLADKYADHRKRPLTEHLEDWRRSIAADGRTGAHVKLQHSRAVAVVEACGFAFWADIEASSVHGHLAKTRATGASIRTSNGHLQATKQFCRWMVLDRRANENPLAHLRGGNVKKDRRLIRRALPADQLRLLIQTTSKAADRYGLTGEERALLYTVAAETGLRADELRGLVRSDLDLSADPPVLEVRAEVAKGPRGRVIPLRPETVKALRLALAKKTPTTRAFVVPHRTADMVKVDRAEAREAWISEAPTKADRKRREKADALLHVDHDGKTFDFHSLRHTFGSNLAASGVHPKEAQELMGHSDINLTMSLYTHTTRARLADAINGLPDLSGDDSGNEKGSASSGAG